MPDPAPASANPAPNPPALWNPSVAAALSLYLFPLGPFLHALNAITLKRPRETRWNFSCFGIVLACFTISSLAVGTPWANDLSLIRLVLPATLIVWFIFIARPQIKHVSQTYGKDYPHKTWTRPVVISITTLFLIAGTSIFIAIVRGTFFKN